MLNKRLYQKTRQILMISVVGIGITTPASACYPGYQKESFLSRYNQGLPTQFFEPQNGKSIEELKANDLMNFPMMLIDLPQLPNWQLAKLAETNPQTEEDYLLGHVGLYAFKNQKIAGYCLLEMIKSQNIDPCRYEETVQELIMNKTLLSSSYLSLEIPAGFQLKIYEEQQGQQISQIALLITPDPPYNQPPYISNQRIVMRAKYHKVLEQAMKVEMTNYFAQQLPIWAADGQAN